MIVKTIELLYKNGRIYTLVEMTMEHKGFFQGLPVKEGQKWRKMEVYDHGRKAYQLIFPYDYEVDRCYNYFHEYIENDW